jgi:hypothetical protein
MFDHNKKIETEIIGQITGFNSFKNYKDEQVTWVNILCNSKDLEDPIEERFNYSTKWNKLNLKKGDKVKFKAKIKRMEFVVHKTERWHDDWGRLPLELTDIEVQIEIQNPSQIIKL